MEYESITCVPALLAHARGTVLEIGPGCGAQLQRYRMPRIRKIIALEPNEAFQEDLRRKAQEMGIEGKYHVEPAKGGLEAWIHDWQQKRESGAESGRPECVVCVQVLCSLPMDLVRRSMKDLWDVLAPGG